jgi:hypothetical protein
MADDTTHLTYEGPPPYVGALAQMLEEEGVTVEYTPPHETRDLSSALAIVAVVLTATGSARDIAAGIQRFRERFGSRAQVRGLPEQRQTPGERLAEVDRLHKEGSITDEERAEQRSRILGEL